MRVARTKAELRAALAALDRDRRSLGLVPTMGYLHEGHVSLLEASVERCQLTVLSLFVNPAQFRPGEDLEAYPRDERRDLEIAAEAGVDVVFAPASEEVYPPGFRTFVEVEGLTDVLCGAPGRRGREHFRGVTTVVAKLCNLVRPDLAFFGAKDAQQVIVVERMVRDLDLDLEIVALPTVREDDGLAMSSRNTYLAADERRRAAAINRALAAAAESAAADPDTGAALERARRVLAEAGIKPEYLEARDAADLSPAPHFNGRPVLVAVAAPVGETRLIDNLTIESEPVLSLAGSPPSAVKEG